MCEIHLQPLLDDLGWRALGVVLIYPLIHIGTVAQGFPCKGIEIFPITLCGVMFNKTRLEKRSRQLLEQVLQRKALQGHGSRIE